MTCPMDMMFESDSGRCRLSYRQIGYGAWKEGIPVERVDGGFLVDGERYEPISE